ncbi:hypothetical protein KNP414_01691 [Paenibacillus mucilaginosus KNP414]|uniref:Uncharacterized protein n=1 Tax=Paenibacillus mucilaginosus (strain KNP414) TaxID=1036673 RepID=F8FPM9_PAEMK|nr:hypothetical protein KNP414_01691 [Paenibacillus mucilaginosus KNP414]
MIKNNDVCEVHSFFFLLTSLQHILFFRNRAMLGPFGTLFFYY